MTAARRYVGRLVGVVVAVVAVLAMTAAPASAHASLEGSQPDSSAVLAAAPTEIVLKFDEQVEVSLGGITLLDQKGDNVAVGAPEHVDGDPTRIRATVPALANGTYVVAWRVISADSHPAQGAFSFVVVTGDQVDINALAQQAFGSRDGRVSPLLGAARLAGFVGLAGLIGGLAFLAIVWPAGTAKWPARRIVWFAWLVFVLSTAAAFGLEGPYAAGRNVGHAFDPSLWRAVARTRYGTWMIVRLVVAVVAGGLVATLRFHRALAWRLGVVASALVIALSFAMAGHAGTGRVAGLGVALDMTHVLSMSVWLGGLALLVVGLRDEEKPPLVARFSAVAVGCVALIVATGVAQSLRMQLSLDTIFSFAWGRAYSTKLVVVMILVAVAYASRRTVRHFWPDAAGLARTVSIEVGLGVAVLVASAVLTGTSPIAQAVASKPFGTTLVEGNLLADVEVSPTRVGPVDVHVTFRYNTGSLLQIPSVDGRLTQEGSEIGPLPVKMINAGPNHFIADNIQVPFPGTWKLELLANDGSQTIRFDVDVKIN
jgi:copper transport protein